MSTRVPHAQSQKAWREKKKASDSEFQATEAKRKRESYIKRMKLTSKELTKRREKGKLASQAFRNKKKADKRKAEESELNATVDQGSDNCRRSKRLKTPPHPGSSNDPVHQSTPTTPILLNVDMDHLIVKLPSILKSSVESKGARSSNKRVNRAASRAYRLLAIERKKNSKLQQNVWKVNKKMQRIASNIKSSAPHVTTNLNNESPSSVIGNTLHRQPIMLNIETDQATAISVAPNTATPVKKAKDAMRCIGISPTKYPSLQKTLTLHNVVISELRNIEGGKKVIKSIIKGKNAKRARCVTSLSKHLSLDRRVFSTKLKKKSQYKKAMKSEMLRRSIVAFLKREDNSTCLPGKKDTVTLNGKKEQKYILSDYLGNLYTKYVMENPSMKVSLSFFIRSRPKYIVTVQYNARRVCLCSRHQNMSLMLRAIQPTTHFTISPDAFIKQVTSDEAIEKIASSCPPTISFDRWQRVDVLVKERKIKKVKCVHQELPKSDFIAEFRSELEVFSQHAKRVHEQYHNVKLLKDSLHSGHVTVQMDFAENWTPGHFEEKQSAYFAKDQITLHPVVLHYMKDSKLTHTSYVMVSNERSHTSGTVFAFMKVISSIIKRDIPQTHTVHYLTDSATSQYRNRHIFTIVSQHLELFQLSATWTYFESGHGKGPCDGIGGASKRMADLAVKRGHVIQTAEEYTTWGNSSDSVIKYIHVPISNIAEANAELSILSEATKITGTMAIHAIILISSRKIATRETSCFKQCCYTDGHFLATCPGWVIHNLSRDQCDEVAESSIVPTNEIVTSSHTVEVNSFVAATYEQQWYIGQVKEYNDGEYLVSFMEQTSSQKVKTFKWPANEDLLWVETGNIITTIGEPQPCGSSRRVFKLTEHDQTIIESAFIC